MLNIGSLVLGVLAWLLATLAIVVPKANISYRTTVLSFTSCAMALMFQMFEINRRVLLGDYAAIEDTIRAVLIASVILVSITTVLNVLAMLKAKNK